MPELPDRLPGEIILASYNNDQRDRLVERYIDATARSVSTPLPVAGTVSYLTASGKFSIFDGATWVDFIDVRGGQSIDNGLTVVDTLFLGNRINFTLGIQGFDSNSVEMARFLRNEMWAFKSPEISMAASRIVNNPDDTPTTLPQFKFSVGANTAIQSQLYAHSNGLMALDADAVSVSLGGSSSVDNRVVRATIATGLNSPVGAANYELLLFTGSSEELKDIQSGTMTKAHGHHPVHLLDVEFKRWSYKDGYLIDGDPRAGEDWYAPTAQSMEAAYPWAVDPDEHGNPGDINSKVLTEGLLWLVQDLTTRLEALENA